MTETRTAVMDEYLDSPMEGEDVFPCKGCGDILEEGKAFELAGNRWHLDCFRCNTCGTLLDSDANLLLLGDGSLICNNCTYSCSACGDKIEDLAILTGEQAFCATCFRCRNCKRKIENLRYARTSQGIFCMSCHESLMARRRKKSKAAAQAKAREKEGSPMVHEKSLPALPPSAIPPNAFSNDRVEPESDTPTELSPRPRPSYPRAESSSRSSSRPARSPERPSDREGGLSLPATTYRKNNRNSTILSGPDAAQANPADEQGFFIPVAFDPSPGPSATSRSTSDNLGDGQKAKDKDYFSLSKSSSVTEKKADGPSAAHIAFQSKGRQPSSEYDSSPAREMSRNPSKSSRRGQNGHNGTATSGTTASPANDDRSVEMVNGKPSQNNDFKLQDAPKSKKTPDSRSNSQPTGSPDGSVSRGSGSSGKDKEGAKATESPHHLQSGDVTLTPRSSQDSRRKDVGDTSSPSASMGAAASHHAKSASKTEAQQPPKNAQPQLSVSTKSQPQHSDDLISPPVPPRHGASADHNRQDSQATQKAPTRGQRKDPAQPPTDDPEDPQASPKLPRWSAGGDFSMDEDMARILGTDEGSSSILRRVSNAVRHGRTSSTDSAAHPHRVSHGRSVSENASPHWPKGATDDDDDVSSAIIMGAGEDSALLKSRLRTSEQRVAELERQFTNEKDLKNISKKLEEKRKTVSVLDTQTEIMIRQLETLAGYVERAKDTKKPIDPRELEESALKDFVQRLEKLKQSMSASLEQLHRERDEVQRDRDQMMDEKERAVSERDRARLEFEQLVSKNAQLADLNNDLTHQIQERFKNNSDGRQAVNGLGIYNHHHKGNASNHSVNLDSSSIQTGTTVVAPDHEEPIVEGPTVVKINKGQVKKFNWKKGSKAMAQRIGQGVNRTVVAFQQPDRQHGMPGDSIGMPYNTTHTIVESPVVPNPNGQMNRGPPGQPYDSQRPGFFGFKKSTTMPTNNRMPGMNPVAETAEAPSVLFGSELSERAEFERRQIPCVVTRCIEEVELRGMDMEGIYRKTGGNSQTKIIQEGFDKNENFDISDPDLDITAVTSVLKQYFRKLPTPLLTYDVYDRVLETNSIPTDHEKWAHLRSVFDQLPRQHKDCLEFLMFHLSRVASREGENLMTPKNLAVVFAPTIMRDLNIEREMTDMHAKNLAVQYIIENSQNIFV